MACFLKTRETIRERRHVLLPPRGGGLQPAQHGGRGLQLHAASVVVRLQRHARAHHRHEGPLLRAQLRACKKSETETVKALILLEISHVCSGIKMELLTRQMIWHTAAADPKAFPDLPSEVNILSVWMNINVRVIGMLLLHAACVMYLWYHHYHCHAIEVICQKVWSSSCSTACYQHFYESFFWSNFNKCKQI